MNKFHQQGLTMSPPYKSIFGEFSGNDLDPEIAPGTRDLLQPLAFYKNTK